MNSRSSSSSSLSHLTQPLEYDDISDCVISNLYADEENFFDALSDFETRGESDMALSGFEISPEFGREALESNGSRNVSPKVRFVQNLVTEVWEYDQVEKARRNKFFVKPRIGKVKVITMQILKDYPVSSKLKKHRPSMYY